MVAPMSLITYEETRPWAKAMSRYVAEREMPPWHASEAQSGIFENERRLTQDEIDTIVRWVEIGAPRGNPKDAPESIDWPDHDGWSIGEPDLVVSMPEPYYVDDDVEDIYRNFQSTITPDMLPEDRWMKAIEFRPGSSVVHHIIAFPLGGIAPGNDPTVFPDGVSRKLSPGTEITWQMHYHKEPGPNTGVWDQSKAAIRFYPKDHEIEHVLEGEPLGRFDFAIPAGDPNYSVQTTFTFPRDSRIVSFLPHMHLRGKSAKYEAFYPDGTHEVLLHVPEYDFNWQTTYRYETFKDVPAGTKLVLTTTWDNSADNPYNPDPTETVYFGEPTTAEMSFGFMDYFEVDPSQAPVAGTGGGRTSGFPTLPEVVAQFDRNDDGVLDEGEAPGPLKRFFDRIDLNKDGVIDMQEAEIAQRFRERVEERQPQAASGR